jgi:cytoskeletal protein RodZ
VAGRGGSERSPLEGLGEPRRGSHRPGGSHVGGLVASLIAVLAVVGLLLGLYTAFGRPGDGSTSPSDDAAGPTATTTSSTTTSSTTTSSAATGSPPTSSSSPAAASSAETSSSASPTSASASASTSSGRRDLAVVVLNQSGQSGRATRAAATLRALGWRVSGVGNFRGTVSATTVYYPPGGRAAAREIAAQLPGTDRVRPAFAGVSRTRITVVLV